ncbi:MAG: DUF1643 domain-containing protein [Pseudomonadales bacterium]|nr:DUF1643 domain-containing protein [Pseudomonadales bacterium]
MKHNYTAEALFYKNGSNLYRKYLDIWRTRQSGGMPGVVIVMLNPGASLPRIAAEIDGGLLSANLDATLKQVATLLDRANVASARVINLSDIRSPDRDQFFSLAKTADSYDIPHSIFDERRRAELLSLVPEDLPIIYAWGVDSRARSLARTAMSTLYGRALFGWKRAGSDWQYYHPLPRDAESREKWIAEVASQLTATNP